MSAGKLREDAETIWRAGVAAVDSAHLVRQAVRRTATSLMICRHEFPLNRLRRIAVVGAGKAGAGMARGFEAAIGDDLLAARVEGWVNVPADCVRPLRTVHLHAARPAGLNEPTPDGVAGTRRILELVSQLGPDDLCVVLISGGGSALLPAPAPPLTLADKQAVTRLLMQSGASIEELNCVRKQLSQVKGGGLARACRAGTLIALIISDVIGDPLDVIASGPTVANASTPADALNVLRQYAPDASRLPPAVFDFLERAAESHAIPPSIVTTVHNEIIGSNRVALAAAQRRAAELGYEVRSQGSDNRGEARAIGRELAMQCLALRGRAGHAPRRVCLLSGGEPVVHLAPTDQPRKGGRNQELVLSAVERLWGDGMAGIAILSGGTDGEDGPTDAAGAVADAAVIEQALELGLAPSGFLAVNNAYPFFEAADGLLKTGPTHTNVMDLRVAVISGGL